MLYCTFTCGPLPCMWLPWPLPPQTTAKEAWNYLRHTYIQMCKHTITANSRGGNGQSSSHWRSPAVMVLGKHWQHVTMHDARSVSLVWSDLVVDINHLTAPGCSLTAASQDRCNHAPQAWVTSLWEQACCVQPGAMGGTLLAEYTQCKSV